MRAAQRQARGPGSTPGPELLLSAWNGSNALYISTREGVIEAWNPGAERLWGISAAEAVGRHIDELVDWDVVSGTGRDLPARLREAAAWSGRTVDRPRIGTRRGELLVIDLDVKAIVDPPGARYVVSSRDVTRSVQVTTEMAPLGALATTGGAVRDRRAIAAQALEILLTSTGADGGIAALVRDGRWDVLAEVEEGRFGPLLEHIDPLTSPLLAAIGSPGQVVSGDPAILPLRAEIREAAAALDLRWIIAVGLWTGDPIGGLLALGWTSELPEEPAETLVVQAAAHLSAALENARLVAEIHERFGAAQAMSARLEALVELARLPEAGDATSLARSVLERLMPALSATAGSVWQLADDRWLPIVETNVHPAFVRLRETQPATGFGVFAGGKVASPYMRWFAAGRALPAAVEAASEAGYSAAAIVPIDEDGRLAKMLILWFVGTSEEIALDERTLDAIGRSVTSAFANQGRRDRLVEVAATEHALAEQYGVMFRDSPNALVRVGGDRSILDINAAALALFGGTVDDWIGRSANDLGANADDERDRLAGPTGDERMTYLVPGRRIDGRTFPMEAIAARLTIDGSESVLIQFRDLTDERRLQAELLQAQKMEAVGQLVAGVAHELNNPLAAIIGFSQLIRRDERLPVEMRHDADLLIQESARTKRIVENLLNFARQRPPERHATHLRSLVDSVIELQAYQFAGAEVRVVVDIPEDLPAVPLDRSQMQQVILNLTQNAIQAIRGGAGNGTVGVAAQQATTPEARPVIRLSVSDDGPGVRAEDRDRLFLPFFTTKEPGEGTGLGLSVSFGIVAGHGGRLTYAPRAGGGSIFTIELPLEPSDGAPASEPGGTTGTSEAPSDSHPGAGPAARVDAPGPGPTRSSRVLVVDDEPAIRSFLARVLSGFGFEPTLAADGNEAIRLAEAGSFDAIVCDHRMAGLTGIEVYEEIAALQPELAGHFVLMSGDVINPELRDFAARHDLVVLAKPFDIETIREAMRTAVGGQRG